MSFFFGIYIVFSDESIFEAKKNEEEKVFFMGISVCFNIFFFVVANN